MKPRPVAALALVGWYLMVPPFRTCSECSRYFQPDPLNAPFDKWEIVDSFDTVAECKKDLLDICTRHGSGKIRTGPASITSQHMAAALHPTPRASRKNSDDRTAGSGAVAVRHTA